MLKDQNMASRQQPMGNSYQSIQTSNTDPNESKSSEIQLSITNMEDSQNNENISDHQNGYNDTSNSNSKSNEKNK